MTKTVNEEVLEFLQSFLAGGVNQDFRPWASEVYQKLYRASAEPTAPSVINAEGSQVLMELFNRMPVAALKAVPEGIAKRVGDFMVANGYRLVFDRWYLQAEPKEPERSAVNRQVEPTVSPAEAFARLREAGGEVLDGVDALNPEPKAAATLEDCTCKVGWNSVDNAGCRLHGLSAEPSPPLCCEPMGNLDYCDLPAGHPGSHSFLTNDRRLRAYRLRMDGDTCVPENRT